MSDKVKDTVLGGKDVNYVYAIFVTPAGKGYGCFAIKRTDNPNSFLVGASYCHPSDRNRFRKKIARNMAAGRANKAVSFDKELKLDSINVVDHMLYSDKLPMPSWANRAYNIGSFTYRLRADQHSTSSLLQQLFADDANVAKSFVVWATNG